MALNRWLLVFIGVFSAGFSVQADANETGNQCRRIFQPTDPRGKKLNQLEATAQSELEAGLQRWRTPEKAVPLPTGPVYPLMQLQPVKHTGQVLPLLQTAGFHLRVGLDMTSGNFHYRNSHVIGQIVAAPSGVFALRPYTEGGAYTRFNNGAVRATLATSGEFKYLGPLFNSPHHPVNTATDQYKYVLGVNLATSTFRAIYNLRELDEGSFSRTHEGAADVFFVNHKGQELPSLATKSGYRFHNVVALSDVLYLGEISAVSHKGKEGDVVLFSYNPVGDIYNERAGFAGFEREQKKLAGFFHSPSVRETAEGELLRDGTIAIRTQVGEVKVRIATGPDGSKHNEIEFFHPTTSELKLQKEFSKYKSRKMRVRVSPTQTRLVSDHFNIEMTHHSVDQFDGIYDKVLVSRFDDAGNLIKSWAIPGDALNPQFYRVNGGFVAQRRGYMSAEVGTPENPRSIIPGPRYSVLFLSDSGQVHEVTNVHLPDHGHAISILNGRLIFFGHGKPDVFIWDFSEWH